MSFTDIIVIILIFIFTILLLAGVGSYKNGQKQAKALNEQLSKDKKTRGEASHAVMLLVKKEDRSKIGFIQSEIYPALELSILIKNNKETVHFAYPYTPELYLVGIKYNPRYSTKTTGKISGRTGSSMIGGALLGTTGSVIGGSGSRNVNTTSKQVEQNSPAVLTFIQQDNNIRFSIEINLNETGYNELFKNFLANPKTINELNAGENKGQEKAENDQPKDTIEELNKYKSLLDNGVINQSDFDAKKKQLMNI